MSASRIDLLTEAQRACLRLVLTHHNSKEIAALLGVSPSAIDKRIERAVQVLGAGSRFEAARLLQRHETAGDIDAPAEPRVMSSATPAPALRTTGRRTGRRQRRRPTCWSRRMIGSHPNQST
ncbi:sigma factor-like helix-turn-helix DNA-binding protein [Sphingomonas aerolata]|uniref:response regulator transcription factor n=1 Tax=Sphingomonas aerolata TaxID=185951 RepID=UPI002FDFABC9